MKITELARSKDDKSIIVRVTLKNAPVKGLKHTFQITGLNNILKINSMGGVYEIFCSENLRKHRLFIDYKGHYSEIAL